MSDVLERRPPRADHRVPYGADAAQFGDLWLPSDGGPFQLVIAIHGGYWRAENDLAHLGHLCGALRDSGFAVFNLEYRRLGMAGGGLRGMLDDIVAGVAAGRALARAFPVDARPPAILGHSAGGCLALWVAKQAAVRGVVALAPISDLRLARSLRLDGGIVDDLLASADDTGADSCALASPIERLPIGARQIIIHGAADEGVPVAMSDAYLARARSLGDQVELRVLPGVDHLEVIDPMAAVWPIVLDAVKRIVACDVAAASPRC
jgi:acetyl esterase/lipase